MSEKTCAACGQDFNPEKEVETHEVEFLWKTERRVGPPDAKHVCSFCGGACDRLPLSGDGKRLAPGVTVYAIHAGSLWVAEILNVGKASVDVRYTNDSSHRAQYCVSRRSDPRSWFTTEGAARAEEREP